MRHALRILAGRVFGRAYWEPPPPAWSGSMVLAAPLLAAGFVWMIADSLLAMLSLPFSAGVVALVSIRIRARADSSQSLIDRL